MPQKQWNREIFSYADMDIVIIHIYIYIFLPSTNPASRYLAPSNPPGPSTKMIQASLKSHAFALHGTSHAGTLHWHHRHGAPARPKASGASLKRSA